MATGGYRERMLAEEAGRERNCSKHSFRAVVKLDPSAKAFCRADLTAALVRECAVYTDGFCAEHGAKDDLIDRPTGLVLWFTSDEKRELFKTRLTVYISKRINDNLTVTA